MWRRVAETSHGQSGCVVAGVAIDSVASDVLLLELVRSTFRDWVGTLAGQLGERGIAPARAQAVATAAVAGMEGALILCRAEQSAAPLDVVAAGLLELLPDEPAE
jgi:TetR/AcrR family transcriptional regulator, lmrAB and yxaGH operons repressor